LCAAIGEAALAEDPRFATNGDRVMARDTLRPLLAARFAQRSTATWLRALGDADVPCGPITDVLTAFQTPEARALGMLVEVEHPAFGVLRQAGIPIDFSATPGSVRTAPPLLGEHTDEVLTELGRSPDEIRRLRAGGVV
jgi:formyl-CoA transferase/CoA:oxalate CoA-transferase